ncbi:tetratricopeptide repeat protein [Thermodesulfobacteriota bacterium]
MKKRVMRRLTGVKIVSLTIILFGFTAAAQDLNELNTMNEQELVEKIDRFEKKLKQNPEDYETLKALGIAYHIMATRDARTYAPLAVKTLSKAHEKIETDYTILCYLGSATTLMSVTTSNFMEKGSYTNRGIAMMDKAVRKAPNNVTIRLTRAYNSKSLPDFLDRKSVAIEDFEHLAAMIEKDDSSLSSIKKEIYLNLAELYEKNGNKEKADNYSTLAGAL